MYPPSRYTAPCDRLVTRITPNTRVKPLDTRKMIPASVSPFRVCATNCCTLGAPLAAGNYRARAPAPPPRGQEPACSTNQAGGPILICIRPRDTPLFVIISLTTGNAARQRCGGGWPGHANELAPVRRCRPPPAVPPFRAAATGGAQAP